MRSIPEEALYVEAQESPVDIRQQYLATKYVAQLKIKGYSTLMTNIYRLSILDSTILYGKRENHPYSPQPMDIL